MTVPVGPGDRAIVGGGGGRGAGARENRGREGYGRREIKVREAGEQGTGGGRF